MPKLTATAQAQRRAHILDAAERCFARSGFHRTTMQDICKQARISAGALYVYFNSKEQLIAGIAERDRAKMARELAELAKAPDLTSALGRLGEQYTVEEPPHKRLMSIEIGLEATRNDAVGEIYREVDHFVLDSLEQLFRRAEAERRIAPEVDCRTLARLLAVIGDGLFWRRAIDPDFDANAILPVIMSIIGGLLRQEPSHERGRPSPDASRDDAPPLTSPSPAAAARHPEPTHQRDAASPSLSRTNR